MCAGVQPAHVLTADAVLVLFTHTPQSLIDPHSHSSCPKTSVQRSVRGGGVKRHHLATYNPRTQQEMVLNYSPTHSGGSLPEFRDAIFWLVNVKVA